MDLSNFRTLNNEFLNKYTDVVTGQSYLIILDIKPDVCMDKNSKDTKNTRKISRRVQLVRNGEE